MDLVSVKWKTCVIYHQAHGTFDNVWIAQVTGSTVIELLPNEHCEDKCEKFEFTLKQGDVCKYAENSTDSSTFFLY